MRGAAALFWSLFLAGGVFAAEPVRISRLDYEDRVRAAWTAQILGMQMGYAFEHKPAAVVPVARPPETFRGLPLRQAVWIDDDYYYEIVALRAFEKYGIGLTVEQLGEQWRENSAGSWGSSEQTRLLLARGVKPPDTGHPRYNRYWFTLGPQFAGDLYGLIAPGMPNLAGQVARRLNHIHGYAEGSDGGVFQAGLVSLAFVETDPKTIVRKAARLIDPASPLRQCLDQVIAMAEAGKQPAEIASFVLDRWNLEYRATNGAVVNAGIVALSLWFGGGDFLRTVNEAVRAADFTDADCNASNAAAVIGALRGMRGLPPELVSGLSDRIVGDEMGGVKLTPPVDETISDLAVRTAAVGVKLVAAHGARVDADTLLLPRQEVETQPPELFRVADLTAYWDREWKLEGAGVSGISYPRGGTYLDGDVLVTFPRDEIRGVVLRRTVSFGCGPTLDLEVAADAGRAWRLEVYANNHRLLSQVIEGAGGERRFEYIHVPVENLAGEVVELRLYQRTLLADRLPSNAYWRPIHLEP
jgi:hypothetical protein